MKCNNVSDKRNAVCIFTRKILGCTVQSWLDGLWPSGSNTHPTDRSRIRASSLAELISSANQSKASRTPIPLERPSNQL